MTAPRWRLAKGDCVAKMAELEPGSVPLVIADCPYNIGRKYDNYDDKRPVPEFLDWSREWLAGIKRVLHRHGSFWLFIGPGLVSELDVICKHELGLTQRGHVVWAFTFGVNAARNFTKAHTHILYYVRTKSKYTFNAGDPACRIPSARQLYNDKRANPAGRLPDDVWVLRQAELKQCFNGDADVWLQSRICGTYHERVKEVDNQLPVEILTRIVRTCSNPGDLVLDPFAGSASTGEAALRLGRRFVGFDISAKCVKLAAARLRAVPVPQPK